MPDILVRDVPESVKRDLKRRAARKGKSLTADLRETLVGIANEERALRKKGVGREKGLGTQLAEIFANVPRDFKIPPRSKEMPRPAKFR